LTLEGGAFCSARSYFWMILFQDYEAGKHA
jgi:hypothetical protein